MGFRLNRRQLLGGGAAAAGVVASGGLLAACGDDDSTSGSAGGPASGTVTLGSNYSDENPKAALAAAVAALPNPDLEVKINTTDHNTYQENINTYLQAPDDVMAWFAGFRMRFFANQGLVGDISDVWTNMTGLGSGFKTASTGDDGKQYFMPFTYYTWAVNYSKSLFEEKGYTAPTDLDSLLGLAEQMMSDGIVPFAFANDGQWPAMGTFDIINMRLNGYDFHIDLMAGKESWTDERVMDVFKTWEQLLPYHQEGANGRTWQEAAASLENHETGMYLLGTFAASAMSDAGAADMDFFAYPELNPEHGQDAVEAPIDGFMMARSPSNEAGAKELLAHLGSATAQDAYLSVDPSVVAANDGADTSVYNELQKKSAELAASSTYISQFLDRDTIPEFASNVMGPALADFISDPSRIGDILADVEEKKGAIFTS